MEFLINQILVNLGENIDRQGLVGTPKRVAESLSFLTKGYQENPEDIIGDSIFHSDNKEMVLLKDIAFYSLCEHHLLPFFGVCHVAYIPDGKVIGLSKIVRIVEIYTHRLQIQENLTTQIAGAINTSLNCKGVAVMIDAKHTCMMIRNKEKSSATLVTTSMLGVFGADYQVRAEFFASLKK